MSNEYLTLLLEYMKDDAVSKCKEHIKEKDADFWYHMGRSDAYQFISDKIKEEQQ